MRLHAVRLLEHRATDRRLCLHRHGYWRRADLDHHAAAAALRHDHLHDGAIGCADLEGVAGTKTRRDRDRDERLLRWHRRRHDGGVLLLFVWEI